MRKTIFSKLFLVAAIAVFIASCSDDDQPPFIQVVTEAGFVSDGDFVDGGQAFMVKINADKGDNDLSSVEFLRDGTRLDPTDLTINGDPASSAAPLLFDSEVESFTWEVGIIAHDAGAAEYTFTVTDANDETASVSITLTAKTGALNVAVNGDTEIQTSPESFTAVALNVTSAGPILTTIGVTSGGSDVAVEDLRFNDADQAAEFSSNPLAFPAEFENGFDGTIYIKAPADGSQDFRITVEDATGETASVDVTLNATTAIDGEFTVVVINNADGPVGVLGGLDLRNSADQPETVTGNPMNPDYARADLVDQGIDVALPAATNWIQKIMPVNGAVLRTPDQAQSEGFTYASADNKEAIIAAFDTGTTKTESDVVAVGDLFVVKKGDDHFLLQCTNVVVTPADNTDRYEFSVKQAFGN